RTYHCVAWSFAGILYTATPASVFSAGVLSHAGVLGSSEEPMASLSAYSSVQPLANNMLCNCVIQSTRRALFVPADALKKLTVGVATSCLRRKHQSQATSRRPCGCSVGR